MQAGSYDLQNKGAGLYELGEPVDNLAQINQGHTCVDLDETNTAKQSMAGTSKTSSVRPNSTVVCISTATTRRQIADVAVAVATAKHAQRATPPHATPIDGTTREPDADFDVAAWRAV